MTTEYLRVKKAFHHQEAESFRKRMELQPELSLAPAWPGFAAPAAAPAAKTSSSESDDGTSRKKRKHYAAGAGCVWEEPQQPPPASLELQLNDPLPLDWEQCLDLQSGRMYYLNRKTLKKSWARPLEQSVNLDLNISTAAIVDTSAGTVAAPDEDAEPTKGPAGAAASSGGSNMVAVPCANCHLLVMLCKSSPSCPNCKFVQPLLAPATPQQAAVPRAHRRLDAVKPLETLSLLH